MPISIIIIPVIPVITVKIVKSLLSLGMIVASSAYITKKMMEPPKKEVDLVENFLDEFDKEINLIEDSEDLGEDGYLTNKYSL